MISPNREDLLLILNINPLTYNIKSNIFYRKIFKQDVLIINCKTPNYQELPIWILKRASNMKIDLDENSCNLLTRYYEGNLYTLNQILQELSVHCSNETLNISHVEKILHDSAQFNLLHLIDSILEGNYKRSNDIIENLQLQTTIKPITVLRAIQKEVMLLITFQRQIIKCNESIISLLNQYKIQLNRHILFNKALKRLHLKKLYQIITLLLQLELFVTNRNHLLFNWCNFESLIWLLCNNNNENNILK